MNPVSTLKSVLLTIGGVITLLLLLACLYLRSEVKDLKADNTQLTESNAKLKQDIELIKVGQTAMSIGQALANDEKNALDTKAKTVKTTLKNTETKIDKLPISKEEKEEQKSKARMDSVWLLYCQIQPDNTACLPEVTK